MKVRFMKNGDKGRRGDDRIYYTEQSLIKEMLDDCGVVATYAGDVVK